MARGYRPNGARRTPPTQRRSGGFIKRTLWRLFLVYVAFVSLFTCPKSPTHPVCRAEAFVHEAVVAPVYSMIVGTETGARVDAAYRAHLVPFYEKHGVPVVSSAQSFVSDTAAPALKKAVQPACDTVHRIAAPHIDTVSALYTAHAKPAVDAARGAVCGAVNRFLIPVASGVLERSVYGVKEYVVPFGRSVVSDHIVPFCTNHVLPRWNAQVKPALCRYTKVAVDYTRTSILPAIADGAVSGYSASRTFAATHIVPHAKRVTVYVYTFFKSNVCPPVHSAYARTLKPHVDRVVPWDKVHGVTSRIATAAHATLDVTKGFVEELYFMCYTIVTGNEHPAVVARIRAEAAANSRRKDSGFVGSIKDRVFADSTTLATDNGQIQHMARKVSGSARQWVQAARGWLGAAVGSAKEGVASYRSRMEQTAYNQYSEATSVVGNIAQDVVSVASVVQETVELVTDTPTATSEADVSDTTASPLAESIAEVFEETVASVVGFFTEKTTEPEYASLTGHAQEAASVVESVAESIAEPAVEFATEALSAIMSEVSELIEEAVVAESAAEEAVTEEFVADKLTSVASRVEDVASEPLVEDTQDKLAETFVVSSISEAIESTVEHVQQSLSGTTETFEPEIETTKEENAVIPETASIASVAESQTAESETLLSTSEQASTPEEHTEEPVVIETSEHANIAPIFAEEAASIVYDAREAMAGVVLDHENASIYEELVKSATKVTENLEAFPSVVMDTEELANATIAKESAETAKASPEKSEDSRADNTLGPEAASELPAAPNKPSDVETPPQVPSTDEEDMASLTTTVPEVSDQEQPSIDDVLPVSDHQDTVHDSAAIVDEDVRKSAFNWVKDARKSISKELAEERTRAGPPTADSVVDDSSSDAGSASSSTSFESVATPETDVPAPNPKQQTTVSKHVPQEPESEPETEVPPVSLSVPELVVQHENPERIIEITPKLEDKALRVRSPPPAKASKTESVVADATGSEATKSELPDAAAPAPIPDQQSIADTSDTTSSESQTSLKRQKKPAMATVADESNKGPRKVKKTKKRVVKKAPAATPTDTSLD
ncbi:hypothetical protein IWW48_001549 [Coemansia sp. RSA 1200]|nr:hypothetical protein IWW48_001549 [Coemansia sp. RSA 1200]